MAKFVALGDLCVRLDEVIAFEHGMDEPGWLSANRELAAPMRTLRIWFRGDDVVCQRNDADGALYEKLKRAMEAG